MSRWIDAEWLMNFFVDIPDNFTLTIGNLRATVNEAPSIEPKRGEWIDDDFVGQYRCSECDYYAIDEYDYCPNCGADMRGKDDE